MDQKQRIDYLINALCRESDRYMGLAAEGGDKRKLLRSLMNVRMPGNLSEDILRVQDEYLWEEAAARDIVSINEIPTVKEEFGSKIRYADRISVWKGDITRLAADAIVNAANSQMLGCFIPCHGCVDNAIHSAAGMQLREECFRMMMEQGFEEPTGRAKITSGFQLPCRFVIHTVGIALDTVSSFFGKGSSIERVVFNVFKQTDWDIYKKLVINKKLIPEY